LQHTKDATVNGATILHIWSPDTDVLFLTICCYPDLCAKPISSQVLGRTKELAKLAMHMLHLGHQKQLHFQVSMLSVNAITQALVQGNGTRASRQLFYQQAAQLTEH